MNVWGYPLPDGSELEASDCEQCGLPVLTGTRYGDIGEPIVLDAMAVDGFTRLSSYGSHVVPAIDVYARHVCPVEGWPA